MSSSIALIQNESMKIYRRPRTWVMFIVLVGMLILMNVLMNTVAKPPTVGENEWRQRVEQSIQENKKTLASTSDSESPFTEYLSESIMKNEYYLEHDINPFTRTLWGTMNDLAVLISLVTLLTIIVAADMIAAEFSWGTIKLLLIRPVTRTKIWLNKYVATLLFSLLLLLVMFIVSFILGGISEGFGGISQIDVYIGSDGLVHQRSMLITVLQTYGFQVVSLIMYVTFAFMISSAFRSSAMAIAFSLGLMLVGSSVVMMFSKYEWVKYVLFANIDLSRYFNGMPLRPDMTLGFSIVVLAVYFIVFHLISWLFFIKRDVAA